MNTALHVAPYLPRNFWNADAMSMVAFLRHCVDALRRDRRGVLMIVFALLSSVVLAGVAMAVDLSRLLGVRAAMAEVANVACERIAAASPEIYVNDDDFSGRIALATGYVEAALSGPVELGIPPDARTSFSLAPKGETVEVSVSAAFDTTFANTIGIAELDTTATIECDSTDYAAPAKLRVPVYFEERFDRLTHGASFNYGTRYRMIDNWDEEKLVELHRRYFWGYGDGIYAELDGNSNIQLDKTFYLFPGTYRLRFDHRARPRNRLGLFWYLSNGENQTEVRFGASATPFFSRPSFVATSRGFNWLTFDRRFLVTEAGEYTMSFRSLGPSNGLSAFIDNIVFEELDT